MIGKYWQRIGRLGLFRVLYSRLIGITVSLILDRSADRQMAIQLLRCLHSGPTLLQLR